MKKIIMVVGAIFFAIVLVWTIRFVVLTGKEPDLDKESKAYVDTVIPKILANISKETLFTYSDDELKKSPNSEFEKAFKYFDKLGKFVEYKGSKGQAKISIKTGSVKVITAYYEADVEFTTGPATAKVTIVKRGNDWKIIGFYINSNSVVQWRYFQE